MKDLVVEQVVGRRPLARRERWTWAGPAQALTLALGSGAVVELTVADEDADAVAEALVGGPALSTARAAVPAPRRARGVVLGVAAVVASLGIALTGVAVSSYLSERGLVPLAQELAADGVLAEAELSVTTGAHRDPAPQVTFSVGTRSITASLLGVPDVPDSGTMAVRYLPDDPTKVLLADDVDYLSEGLLGGAVGMALLGLAPAVVLLVVSLVARRTSTRRPVATPGRA